MNCSVIASVYLLFDRHPTTPRLMNLTANTTCDTFVRHDNGDKRQWHLMAHGKMIVKKTSNDNNGADKQYMVARNIRT